MKQRKIKVTLPADLIYLPMILNSVKSLGKILGFDADDVSALETGTKEAITSVVKYAFQNEGNTTFDIILVP
ncbi:MAG: hypothetical protein GY869_01990, partial [Planctomycetes bacterium]|nr:hypothetical protein [Planctomycetota bacterium]